MSKGAVVPTARLAKRVMRGDMLMMVEIAMTLKSLLI
jgi:hypothetical protein